MASPSVIALTANTWTKVASAVYTGVFYPHRKTGVSYQFTYRLTGSPAPSDFTGVRNMTGDEVHLQHSESVDVWFYSVGAAGELGVFV